MQYTEQHKTIHAKQHTSAKQIQSYKYKLIWGMRTCNNSYIILHLTLKSHCCIMLYTKYFKMQ